MCSRVASVAYLVRYHNATGQVVGSGCRRCLCTERKGDQVLAAPLGTARAAPLAAADEGDPAEAVSKVSQR